jgi:4a-hydroxytetrahydrobiopterin dehydratase
MATRQDLTTKRCKPCEGGVPALAPSAVAELMQALHEDWRLAPDGKSISRSFGFSGYHRTIGFVNAVAWIANGEGHHPDLEVTYGKCLVKWWTHAVGGLTENDFICAAKVDRLVDQQALA